jgi:DNA-binding transcriptional LysR family regulator
MELRQLEYFVAVAEEANFTRAAERVHVAQPGISAQVRRLERELGHELFDRSGRTVRLTAVGEAVLPHARAALEAVAGVRTAVDDLSGLLGGRLAIGALVSCAVGLPDLLAGFHDAHPGVEISLVEDDSARLVEALRSGALDAAFVALTMATPQGIDIHVLTDEPIVVAVGPGDPWSGRKGLAVTQLRDRPLVSLPVGTGLRACLDEACTAAGFRPTIALEAGDPGVLADLAARGLGPAILPESLARARSDLHAVALRPQLRGRVALAWRSDGPTSPAARAFLARARAELSRAA